MKNIHISRISGLVAILLPWGCGGQTADIASHSRHPHHYQSKAKPTLTPPPPLQPTQTTGITPFFLPIGGGTEASNSSVRIEMYGAALKALAENRAEIAKIASAQPLGDAYCFVENDPTRIERTAEELLTTPFMEDLVYVLKRAVSTRRLPALKFRAYLVNSRNRASAFDSAEFLRSCGILHIPGGDQTEARNLWVGTPFQAAVQTMLRNGGGLVGSSAGGAIQGSLGYFPNATRADDEIDTQHWVSSPLASHEELADGLFTTAYPASLPRFYVETHSEERERTARALAILAVWETKFKVQTEARTQAIALDSDTGVLIRYSNSANQWTGEVVGAESAEFLLPTSATRIGLANGIPFATNYRSHVLFSGATVALSGANQGDILTQASATYLNKKTLSSQEMSVTCASRLPTSIRGSDDRIHKSNSETWYEVRLRDIDDITLSDIVPITYHEVSSSYNIDTNMMISWAFGDFRAVRGSGCGVWLPRAFDAVYGQRRNRAPAIRFALGSGASAFGVLLPQGITAQISGDGNGKLTLQATGTASATLIHDVRHAKNRGISAYVYSDYFRRARNPMNLGSWEDGQVHLLPPGGSFIMHTGETMLPHLSSIK